MLEAIVLGDTHEVKRIIGVNPSIIYLRCATYPYPTPLLTTAILIGTSQENIVQSAQINIMKILVDAGASILDVDAQGNTAWDIFLQCGYDHPRDIYMAVYSNVGPKWCNAR